jgi:chromosome condensin MukBEF MukE localization factor
MYKFEKEKKVIEGRVLKEKLQRSVCNNLFVAVDIKLRKGIGINLFHLLS